MPKHVWMALEAKLGAGAGPINHSGESSRAKWRAALGDERECRFRLLLALKSAQSAQFIA
jgi:hypothetical protein